MSQIIIQVILDHSLIRSEVTLCELVDVHVVVTSEKIVEDLIVLSAVPLVVDATCNSERLACIPLHVSTEIDIILVHATLLEHILGACYTIGVKVIPVYIVESVPVEVGILRNALLPCVLSPCRLLCVLAAVVRIVHPVVARKVTVVVRTWIRCIIPVHCSVSVLTCSPKERCRSLKIVCRRCGILEDGDWLECLADTCITYSSVLVTPVRVIHVVTHHIVNLLSRSVLRAALARCREGHEADAVNVAELLLNTCIVCKVTVEHTVNPVVSTDTC